MNSNKKIQTHQTLYLKQFFNNFFQRKYMLETISNFNNGLSVLESLIQNFEITHNLNKISKKQQKQVRIDNQFASDIEREGKCINRTLQDIYDRLKNVFDAFDQNNSQYQQASINRHLQTYNQCNDDELYEILNKYKHDLKKQKQQKANLQREIQKFRNELQHQKKEKKNILQQCQKMKINNDALKQKNRLYQEDIKQLQEQIDMFIKQKRDWEQKMQEYANLQLTINHISQQNQSLKSQLSESHQKQKIAAEKLKHIDSIIKLKMTENEAKWQRIIQQKINNKNIYSVPTCKIFKQFLHSFNKENLQTTNKQ